MEKKSCDYRPCKGRVPSILGFGKSSCGILGWDSLTFASGVLSAPLPLPLARLAAEGRRMAQVRIGRIKGGSEAEASAVEGRGAAAESSEGFDAEGLGPEGGPSVALFRGFGTCRHAYAVTPAGARWMLEVLLRAELSHREEARMTAEAVETRKTASWEGGSEHTGGSSGSRTSAEAALSWLAWQPRAGDSAVARAAVWDYRHHQTFFARLFSQTEWSGCGAARE
jgi:hypothetical protein